MLASSASLHVVFLVMIQLKRCVLTRKPVVHAGQKTHGGATLGVCWRALPDRLGDLTGGETAAAGYARSPVVIASRL